MKFSVFNPFRIRGLLVGMLALGLLVGVWLGDLFQGFGWGPGSGGGTGSGTGTSSSSSASKATRRSTEGTADLVGYHTEDPEPDAIPDKKLGSGGIVKVLIDDRNYYLRKGGKKQPIDLESLVRLIEQTEPDEDGRRAIIDRTLASRPTAEVKLYEALKEAGITDNSVYLAPKAVE